MQQGGLNSYRFDVTGEGTNAEDHLSRSNNVIISSAIKGESGDSRFNFMGSKRLMHAFNQDNVNGAYDDNSNGGSVLRRGQRPSNWYYPQLRSLSSSNYALNQPISNDETEQSESDTLQKFDRSPRAESVDSNQSIPLQQSQIVPPTPRFGKVSALRKESRQQSTTFMGRNSKMEMNFIILTGFLISVLFSVVLQCLVVQIAWIQKQVQALRIKCIGHANMWKFFNFEDNSIYSMRTKIFLLPVIFALGILQILLAVLEYGSYLLLAKAPNSLIGLLLSLLLNLSGLLDCWMA